MNYKGIDYLRAKLASCQNGVKERYQYYAMSESETYRSLVIPQNVRMMFKSILEWTTKGVDALADRIVFREIANDDFNSMAIFKANNPDVFFDTAIQSALIASCCFVYIAQNGDSLPKLQVIDGSKATGIIDPTTNLLREGYAILDSDEYGNPLLEAYFTKESTYYIPKNDKPYTIENQTERVLLVPIIHRPDAVRPFGRSRISKASMYWQDAAKRTLERAEVTAEFYSFPQKYVLGLDPDAEPLDKWKATISSLIEFSKDEDGDKPSLGQFQTSSMAPFIDQLRMQASGFAGGTGLTLDDLGFPSDNPSSVEAIKAAHENLRIAGKKAQRSFASGFLNVAYTAVCLRDNIKYDRIAFMDSEIKWQPLFEADANMLSLVGDGAIKLNQAIPDFITKETLYDFTGIKGGGSNE